MKVAILGPSCFGLALGRMALAQGHDVIAYGRSPLRPPCFALGYPKNRYIQLGVSDVADALTYFEPAVIVNFAAQGEGAASFDPATWRWFYDTNSSALAELTGRLLGAPWLMRFIHIGSSEVYGSVQAAVTEDAPIRASSPYSASKAAFDLHLQAIHRARGFPAIIVRPSNGYGPGQQLHRVIPRAMLAGLTGQKLPLHGGGRARKSYVHADDLARAILMLIDKGELGEVYNVGPAEPISIRGVLEACATSLAVPFDRLVDVAPERTGQDGCYWINSSKMRELGWAPSFGFEAGVDDVRTWTMAHLEELRRQPIDYVLRP